MAWHVAPQIFLNKSYCPAQRWSDSLARLKGLWREGMNLGEPQDVVAATESYHAEQDTMGAFLEECCHFDDLRVERASRLFRAWSEWCKARGEWAGTQTAFGLRLSDRGFAKDRPASGPPCAKTIYKGIGLDDTVGERLGQAAAAQEEGEEFCPF